MLTLKGQHVSETYLVPGRCIIGRTPDNDIQVESKYVSRHHAQVITTTEASWIEDLNSTNGIFVRGAVADTPGAAWALAHYGKGAEIIAPPKRTSISAG